MKLEILFGQLHVNSKLQQPTITSSNIVHLVFLRNGAVVMALVLVPIVMSWNMQQTGCWMVLMQQLIGDAQYLNLSQYTMVTSSLGQFCDRYLGWHYVLPFLISISASLSGSFYSTTKPNAPRLYVGRIRHHFYSKGHMWGVHTRAREFRQFLHVYISNSAVQATPFVRSGSNLFRSTGEEEGGRGRTTALLCLPYTTVI